MRSILFLAVIFMPFIQNVFAQGCSDAGFCTVDGFKPATHDTVKKYVNQFKIGGFYGSADNAITVYGSYLEYNRQINDKMGLDVKLTSIAQSSTALTTFGLSDVFVNYNYTMNKKVKLTLGTKLPLSNAQKSSNNLPIPMDFQSSLGTVDLIFGIGLEVKKFKIVAAIQQPLTQNKNQYLNTAYIPNIYLSTFQSTNKFVRSGDVLLRLSYPMELSKKWILTPSILPIYHLKNDKFTNEMNQEVEILKSNGLTLNGNMYLDIELNSRNFLQLNAGMPFIVRDVRPDGLTRSFIANIEYRFKL